MFTSCQDLTWQPQKPWYRKLSATKGPPVGSLWPHLKIYEGSYKSMCIGSPCTQPPLYDADIWRRQSPEVKLIPQRQYFDTVWWAMYASPADMRRRKKKTGNNAESWKTIGPDRGPNTRLLCWTFLSGNRCMLRGFAVWGLPALWPPTFTARRPWFCKQVTPFVTSCPH